jgi:hypothetical protein
MGVALATTVVRSANEPDDASGMRWLTLAWIVVSCLAGILSIILGRRPSRDQ